MMVKSLFKTLLGIPLIVLFAAVAVLTFALTYFLYSSLYIIVPIVLMPISFDGFVSAGDFSSFINALKDTLIFSHGFIISAVIAAIAYFRNKDKKFSLSILKIGSLQSISGLLFYFYTAMRLEATLTTPGYAIAAHTDLAFPESGLMISGLKFVIIPFILTFALAVYTVLSYKNEKLSKKQKALRFRICAATQIFVPILMVFFAAIVSFIK